MRILLADDEDTLRSVISQVLVADGHEVTGAASGEKALDLFRQDPYPLIITDIVMGKMSGLDLLREVKTLEPDCMVVVMTSHASLETAMTALRNGAYDYLTKPFDDIDMISAVVNRAVEKIRLASDNRRLLDDLTRKTTELERLNESLRDMADRDGLTGLYNHRYFRDAFDRELSRAERHGRPFSVILLDVDHFKNFNDSLGHLMGDEALKQVADILRSHCRATSVAARYGGEEFVVLVPEANKDAALILADRVRRATRDAEFVGETAGVTGRITISLGVATFSEDGRDRSALLEQADRALYRAKECGRDQTCAAGRTSDLSPVPVSG